MYDVIVIGSGIAGLYTALLVSQHARVAIVTKGELEESNTRYAQGGIAAAVGGDDSTQAHYDDTIAAGAGLCDPHAVHILTRHAPARVGDLMRFGVSFDREGGRLALGREGAHSRSRVLHVGGDATGMGIETALGRAVRRRGIALHEKAFVCDLLVEDGRVGGVLIGDRDGHRRQLRSGSVILASGGSGELFSNSTNPSIATGDGLAAAWRAGAVVADVEFFQFHPTALHLPGAPRFLISEAMRGEGGVLRDMSGHAFMKQYDDRGDLASRDVVSRAIAREMALAGTDCVHLDVTHLPPERMLSRFPTIARFCGEHGLDITREPIPVVPAAHYQIGGVLTDCWGATSLPGLYACGEVAASGVHGANRLASNSLLEGLVFGWRISRHLLGEVEMESSSQMLAPLRVVLPVGLRNGVFERPSRARLQRLMWDEVGLFRTAEGLRHAAETLAAWAASPPVSDRRSDRELVNLVTVGRLMANAALLRAESRGAHYRLDAPETDPAWRRRIFMTPGAVIPPAGLRHVLTAEEPEQIDRLAATGPIEG